VVLVWLAACVLAAADLDWGGGATRFLAADSSPISGGDGLAVLVCVTGGNVTDPAVALPWSPAQLVTPGAVIAEGSARTLVLATGGGFINGYLLLTSLPDLAQTAQQALGASSGDHLHLFVWDKRTFIGGVPAPGSRFTRIPLFRDGNPAQAATTFGDPQPLPASMVYPSAGLSSLVLNSVAAAVAVDPDADRDGMPLEFEQRIIDASLTDGINAPADVLPCDDFDRDGLPNLVEHAVGGDPTVPDTWRAPKAGMAAVAGRNYLTLAFRRLKGNTSLLYQVEESTDLRTWFPLSVNANIVGAPIDQGDGTELVTVRATGPVTAGRARYLRLAVARDADADNDGMDDDFEQRIADANASDGIIGPEHVTGTGDFDGDGVPDILESAFGMDPTVNGQRERMPVAGRAAIGGQTYLTISYRRLKGARPCGMLVQESTDLTTWTTLDQAALVIGSAVDMGDGTERITIRRARPGSASFLRVAVLAN
jgi:hypothetical protein